jgi:hypothetical protein
MAACARDHDRAHRCISTKGEGMQASDSTSGGRLAGAGEQGLGAWMRANLTTQGYCLSDDEPRDLSLALRFSTGTCLLLVVTALVLGSPAMIFVLSGVGVVAGLQRAPSLRPSMELRRPPPRPRACPAAQPDPASPCVQGGDRLAACGWGTALGWHDHGRAGSRRPARRGLRHGDRDQSLHSFGDAGLVGASEQPVIALPSGRLTGDKIAA